jgi:hypothetical protein
MPNSSEDVLLQPIWWYPRCELQSLLLCAVRLRVLEGEAAGALVEMVISAGHGLVAGEHDAVQGKCGKDGAAKTTEDVAHLAGPAVAAVAVEAGDGMVDG